MTFPLLGQVLVLHANGTTTSYNGYSGVADADTDRGTVLMTALAAAVSGETVLLGPGRFDVAINHLPIAAGVSLYGAGKDLTWILSQAVGGTPGTRHAVYPLRSNSRHGSFTFFANNQTTFVCPMGGHDTDDRTVTNCSVSDVRVMGPVDAFQFNDGSAASDGNYQVNFFRCDGMSGFDCWALTGRAGSTATFNLYDCTGTATYPSPINPLIGQPDGGSGPGNLGQTARALDVLTANFTVNIYRGRFTAGGVSNSGNGINNAVHCGAGRINLYGATLQSWGENAHDILIAGSGVVAADPLTQYDLSKVSGGSVTAVSPTSPTFSVIEQGVSVRQ